MKSILARPHPQTTRAGSSETTLQWAIVATCCLIVLLALAPEALITDVLPWRTDLTGHVVVPWADRSDPLLVLPGSWSDAMFTGFPINQLYPWLPSFLAAVLSWVLPLAVAFKIVVVAPLVLLPWAAWRAARWAALPTHVALLLAVSTLPFLFDTSCVTCGGNIASTINGEYAFAWSLLFGVLALGAIDKLARTGVGLVSAVLLATGTTLSHPLPALWLLVGVFTIAVGREVWAERRRLVAFVLAAASTILISAIWWIPFATRRDWMPLIGFARREDFLFWLFPATPWWQAMVVGCALAGVVWAARQRHWFLIAIAVQTTVAALAFLRIGEGQQVYNLRMLPFWYLGVWTLAAVGFGWIFAGVLKRLSSDRAAEPDQRLAPIAALAAAIVVIGSTWGWFGVSTPPSDTQDGTGSLLGVSTTVTKLSLAPSLVFGGPRTEVGRASTAALETLIRDVAGSRGCGLLAWDETDILTSGLAGSENADAVDVGQLAWQSPIWTDGCINPITGILLDSSATGPAAVMTQDLVSTEGLRIMETVEDLAYNLPAGVTRMRTMGVRYYLTRGGAPAEDAADEKGLVLVASAGPWSVWEVDGFSLVAPLKYAPAVVDPPVTDKGWIPLATAYFVTTDFDEAPLAQDGPADWPRVAPGQLPPRIPLDPVRVSDVMVSSNSVSFSVDRPGTPVMVKASAFPGWVVRGADVVHRSTPNFMIVVPTSNRVTLVKGRTAVDLTSATLGVLGLALLTGAATYRRLEHRRVRALAALGRATQGDDEAAGASDDDAPVGGTETTERVGEP